MEAAEDGELPPRNHVSVQEPFRLHSFPAQTIHGILVRNRAYIAHIRLIDLTISQSVIDRRS